METFFIRRYWRLPRRELAYLRFLVESYEGLVFLRTLDGREGVVEIAYAPSCRRDAERLLAALEEELGLVETPLPPSF